MSSDYQIRHFKLGKILSFFDLEDNQKNKKKLLADLKKYKIPYGCSDSSNQHLEGHFLKLTEVFSYPNEEHIFIDSDNTHLDTIKIHKNDIDINIKKVTTKNGLIQKLNKNISIKADAPVNGYERQLLLKHKYQLNRSGDYYYLQVSTPKNTQAKLSKCFVSNYAAVKLYFSAQGQYRKPKSIPFYNEIISEIRYIAGKDNHFQGFDFDGKTVRFNSAVFKVNEKQLAVIKNIYSFFKQTGKPVSNEIAFRNVSHDTCQISDVLSDIKRKNKDSGYSISHVIFSKKSLNRTGAFYIFDIPDYW